MTPRQKYKITINGSTAGKVVVNLDEISDKRYPLHPEKEPNASGEEYEELAEQLFHEFGYKTVNLSGYTLRDYTQKNEGKEPYKLVLSVLHALDEESISEVDKAGIPDILAYRETDGHLFEIRFAEVKSYHGVLSTSQKQWIHEFEDEVPIDLIRLDKENKSLDEDSNFGRTVSKEVKIRKNQKIGVKQ